MTSHVGVAYATETRQVWIKFDVPNGSSLQEAIALSGILKQFPDIDLETQKVGVFGKIKKLTDTAEEGDRIEIYRPIVADPEPILAKEEAKKAEAKAAIKAKMAAAAAAKTAKDA